MAWRSAGATWNSNASAGGRERPEIRRGGQVLATPQGRFLMAGDQITYWSGWQEGAVISAHAAVQAIDRHLHPTAR